MRLAALVATLATLGAPACTQARVIDGTITRVADGDTVWMQPVDRTRAPIKLRLHGIDAPERCQAWGAQSRDALAARVLLRHVVVSTRSRDDYGRALGADHARRRGHQRMDGRTGPRLERALASRCAGLRRS